MDLADDDPRQLNHAFWEQRAAAHAASSGYRVEELVNDPTALSEVVTFDLPRLGRLDGLDVVHLQCHIGTDTISLSRLGARSITGLDFSPAALEQAALLAQRCGIEARWVQSELYGAAAALGARYDLVYTGIGVLSWLPDIRRWAQTVSDVLRPGGRLFIREGHPVVWTLDDHDDGKLAITHPYFEGVGNLWPGDGTTYVETDQQFDTGGTYEWNHGLAEIIQAVLDAGMTLTAIEEHTTLPWQAIEGMRLLPDQLNEWQLADRPERLPHSYTLQALKRG